MKNVICISSNADVQKNFEARVERLFANGISDDLLLTQMVDLLDAKNRDQAYAKLAIWDLTYEDYCMGFIASTTFDAEVLEDDEPMDDDDIDPYALAEETKDLVLKKFGGKVLINNMEVAVLMNLPWDNGKNQRYKYVGETYYRALARRTFMQYRGDGIYENVVKKLKGIVVIDERSYEGEVHCYVYSNPNCEDDDGTLKGVANVANRMCDYSEFEDFKNDNY